MPGLLRHVPGTEETCPCGREDFCPKGGDYRDCHQYQDFQSRTAVAAASERFDDTDRQARAARLEFEEGCKDPLLRQSIYAALNNS